MSGCQDLVERRIQDFRRVCRERSVRVTPQRMAVFRELASTTEHPDAETIHERIRARMPSVSLDTVYRTLSFLEAAGLSWKVDVLAGRARYDANCQMHHHLICTTCGVIKDYDGQALDPATMPAHVEGWGDVTFMHVQLRGTCAECKAKMEKGATAQRLDHSQQRSKAGRLMRGAGGGPINIA
jgi:Fur family peroxide stress response transcriptional regulator